MARKLKPFFGFVERVLKNMYFQIIISVFLLDRITKVFALNRCPCVVGPLLNIVTVANNGIAFGLFQGRNSNLVFAILSMAIVSFLYYFAFKKLDGKSVSSKGIRLGITFMIAGALANIVDRLFFGYVLDILSFHVGLFYFPVFNIADASITFGAIIAIIYSLFDRKLDEKKSARKVLSAKKDSQKDSLKNRNSSSKEALKSSTRKNVPKKRSKKTKN